MIADKIIPSFYLLNLEGEAANFEFLFGSKFNVKRVCIASGDFDCDLTAMQAGKDAIEYLINNPAVNTEHAEEVSILNPDFFPSLPKLELTSDALERRVEYDAIVDHFAEENKVATVMSFDFDKLGDFVTLKHNVTGEDFLVELKVAVHPQIYLEEKSHETLHDVSRFGKMTNEQQLHIH